MENCCRRKIRADVNALRGMFALTHCLIPQRADKMVVMWVHRTQTSNILRSDRAVPCSCRSSSADAADCKVRPGRLWPPQAWSHA